MKFEKNVVFFTYVSICITAPISGVIIGGSLVQSIGGYESKHSILFCIVILSLGALGALPLYWLDQILFVGAVFWFIMFCGGCAVPSIIGILISSLPKNLRGPGNSISNILIFFLGWFPGPYFYSVVYDNSKNKFPRLAMSLTLGMAFVGLIFLIIAAIIRYEKFKDPLSQENLNLSSFDKNQNSIHNNSSE